VKDQLEGQMMQATKQEVASALAPGIQQQGQAMQAQQLQQAMGGGVASQPAPNMVGMARGGIVGYQQGGDVQAEEVPYSMNALRAFDERRRLEQELKAAGLAEAEAKALAQDPASAQNVLRSTMNVRNMPSEAPAGVASVLSEGTPARDIPVSMDALSRQDARRAAERAAEMEQRRSVLTGDPIADNIIQSRRAAETMTPEQAEYLGRRREEPSRPSRFIEALGGAPSAGGGTGRVTYMGTEPSIRGFLSDPQSYRDMRENVAGVPVVGEALDKWLAKAGIGSSTTQDVEADPASAVADALIVYAGSGLLKAGGAGAGALFRMMANNPRFTAALAALGIKGGDELIDFARQNVPGVVSDEGGNAEAGIASLPATATTPSGAGTAPTTRPAVSRTGIASPSPRGAPSAEEAAMQAVDDRANQYQATDEDVAAITETLPLMRTAQREAPQDPRMSRYEQQYDKLIGEQEDKLGALIAFLQGAGASGGTNLGATLMGGGSGIQARDARIKDELAKTIQNIETLQLERDQMTSEDERAMLSRENQLAVAKAQSGAQRPTDTTQMVEDYTAYIMAQNPGMSEVEARYKAREQVQADEMARAQAAAGVRLPVQQGGLNLQFEQLVADNLNSAIEALPINEQLTLTPERRASMEAAERAKLRQALYGEAPEQGQSTAPQGQRPPLESMFNQ
jgi:hypothetical protein